MFSALICSIHLRWTEDEKETCIFYFRTWATFTGVGGRRLPPPALGKRGWAWQALGSLPRSGSPGVCELWERAGLLEKGGQLWQVLSAGALWPPQKRQWGGRALVLQP